jgi:hypothetical protein
VKPPALPHITFPTVSAAALERECERELAQRRRFYEGRVAKGNMTPEEAKHGLAIAAAWREDVARIRAAWIATPGTSPAPPAHEISWRERRAGLLRELDMRARFYPGWIASGRLLQADADRQVKALECLLAIYEDGWDWRGSDGLTPFRSAAADAEFNALQADRAARRGTAQEELVLQ